MALSDFLTQGGQTFLHKTRMLKQVMRLAFYIAASITILSFILMLFIQSDKQMRYQVKQASICYVKKSLFGKDIKIKIQNHTGSFEILAINYLKIKKIQSNLTKFKAILKRSTYLSIIIFFLSFLFIIFIWIRRGIKEKRKKHISGQKLIHWIKLKLLLKIKRKASSIKIGKVPLLKNSETKHIFISGSTGTGKSNCITQLLQQLNSKKQKVVIVDTTGEYVKRFYRKEKDILLNPLDKRSFYWHPWIECKEKYHYVEMANNFISHNSNDPFWSNSSKVLLSSVLQKMGDSKNYNIQVLLDLLNKEPLENLYKFLENTEAASLVEPTSEKTAASIRANTNSYINSLSYLPIAKKNIFSIRNWVQKKEDDSWLFLTMLPEQRSALRSLISAWTSIVIKSTLGKNSNNSSKLWIILDELASLHELKDLPTFLAEGRKYGGCAVLGLQSLPQLEEIYGPHTAKVILDLCSTKILFRMGNYELARRLSKALGEREISETQEGISYGANEIRDGVSISKLTRQYSTISPTDLLTLNNLEAYMKIPGNYPITKMKMKYFDK